MNTHCHLLGKVNTLPSNTPPANEKMKPRVVFVGGGHSSIQTIDKLRGASTLTLINEHCCSIYSGMIPGVLSSQYSPSEALIHVESIVQSVGGTFVCARAISVDWANSQVICERICEEETPSMDSIVKVPFDILVIDVGSSSRYARDIPGVLEYTIPTRPIARLPARVQKYEKLLLERLSVAKIEPVQFNVVVVGGGAAGIEIICCVAARFEAKFANTNVLFQYTILDRNESLEQSIGRNLGKTVQKMFDSKPNFMCVFNAEPARVHQNSIELRDGRSIHFDMAVWATGSEPPEFLRHTDCPLDSFGYLKVNQYLQGVSHPNLFAAGDCVHFNGRNLPKSGVYAVRMGPVLAHNIQQYVEYLSDKRQNTNPTLSLLRKPLSLQEYKPQSNYLKLLNIGNGYAILEYYGYCLGPFRWIHWLKDHIDRKFLNQFFTRSDTSGS